MKSKRIFALVIFIMTISVIGVYYTFANSNTVLNNSVTKSADTVYTCSMHPEVISDRPGQCPKCGMDLIKKEDNDKDKSMNMKDCMDKCNGMGCNMDKYNGESGACKDCTNDCKNMMKKDEKKMDKDCKSDCKKH